jgi:hypothetical protein
MTACDPGMTIRQVNSSENNQSKSGSSDTSIIVHVDTVRPLTGEIRYFAGVYVTNPLDSPIVVTKCQLESRGRTYSDNLPGPATFPLMIKPAATERFNVWFDLDDDLWTTFHQTTGLVVYYRIGNNDSMVRATLIGAGKLRSLFWN